MTIKAIVFDIGGVLLRTEDHSPREALEEKYGLAPNGADELVFNSQIAKKATVGLVETSMIWLHVAKTLNLTPNDLVEFKRSFWAGDRLDKNLLTYLQNLKKDYITALLSNAWGNMRKILARDFNIFQGVTVDQIIISAEVGAAKPDPKIFTLLAEKLCINFDQILFIDDFVENVTAAKKLGIITIHYKPNLNLIEKIESKLNQ